MEPEPEFAYKLKLQVAAIVKKQYPAGVYKNDSKKLVAIVNLMVSEYNKILQTALDQSAGNQLIQTSLWQYSEQHKVLMSGSSNGYTQQALEDAEIKTRAHKYLAERCLAFQRDDELCKDKNQCLMHAAEAMVCADQIVHLSVVSDQIANDVMVSDFELTIPASDDLIQIDGNRADYKDFGQRLALSNQMRNQIFSGSTIDLNENKLSQDLEPAFSKEFLFRYGEIMELIEYINEEVQHAKPGAFGTMMVEKANIIMLMKEYAKQHFTISDQQCEQILAGLTVFPNKVAIGNKGFFNPQLESRALKRCFFETTFNGKLHLAWVPELVDVSIEAITKALAFGEFPLEWSSTKEITDRVSAISNERGDWFEKEIARVVKTLGIKGPASNTAIGQKKFRIKLLPKPGELDFIGWSPNDKALVVAEAKMLKWAGEPRVVRNQDQKFTEPTDGYVDKLNRKIEWIANNLEAVIDALKSDGWDVGKPASINSAFITFEPVFAKYKVKNYPVVSLAEFVDSYTKAGKWPYIAGVRQLP